MEDEKRIEELKIKVLDKIPDRYKKLKQIIATRSFSEEELGALLKSATVMRELRLYKLKKEKLGKQMMLGSYPLKP